MIFTEMDRALVCPACGEPVEPHPKHNHYYCIFCRKYVKPTSRSAFDKKRAKSGVCPTCSEPTSYHPEHDHHFCLSCRKYVEPLIDAVATTGSGLAAQKTSHPQKAWAHWLKKNALWIIVGIILVMLAAAAISGMAFGLGLLEMAKAGSDAVFSGNFS